MNFNFWKSLQLCNLNHTLRTVDIVCCITYYLEGKNYKIGWNFCPYWKQENKSMAREMWQVEESHLEVSKESFQAERRKAWQNEQKSHN